MMIRCLSLLLVSLSPMLAAGGGRGNPVSGSLSQEPEQFNSPLSAAVLKAQPKAVFQRVLQARVSHLGSWTLEDSSQTPVTVGRTIASMRPTFVTGLLKVLEHGVPGNAESEAYMTIRSAVCSSVKGCRFDIVIDSGNEAADNLLVRRMKEIDNRIHPDAWTLYIPPDDSSIRPDSLAGAISFAHSRGAMAGYDGPLSVIPEGVDYIVVRTWNLQVNREQLERLSSRRVPLIVEIPTTLGGREHPDCSRYIHEMEESDRASALTALASNQGSWGYRLAYPLFHPLQSSRKASEATKDSILMVTIRSLITRFN